MIVKAILGLAVRDASKRDNRRSLCVALRRTPRNVRWVGEKESPFKRTLFVGRRQMRYAMRLRFVESDRPKETPKMSVSLAKQPQTSPNARALNRSGLRGHWQFTDRLQKTLN